MKVLVLGSGGREHALCWAISKSPLCKKIYCIPGNAGINSEAECIDIKINNHYLGSIYKLNTEIKKQYNLKSENFTAIINLDKLMRYRSDNLIKFVKPSQYPGTSRDISILVNSKVKNIDLKKCIFENAGELLTNIQLFDYYKGKDIDDDKVSLSYSLLFQSFSRTLHDVEIDEIIIRILSSLSKKYKAIQR